ncbi:MAG: diguanylate cyclase [Candidatus Goldiibacteriota bacterium]
MEEKELKSIKKENEEILKELKNRRKENDALVAEIKGIKEKIKEIRSIEKGVKEKYEEMLKKEEIFLGEINREIEREITVVVLASIKKTVNKEMKSLKLLRKRIRSQVRNQVAKQIGMEIEQRLPEITAMMKQEVKKTSVDIMNQLKRQTGRKLEKEVKEQVKEKTHTLQEQMEESERRAIIDGLTGAFNRRFFENKLEDEIQLAKRFRSRLSLVMFDIDHFKPVNDTHGHTTGDIILQEVVETVKECLSSTDSLCRYGGEEFAVIMPDTPIEKAIDIAEHIRKAIEEHMFYSGDVLINITISLGVSEYPSHGILKEVILEKADAALYKAKHDGRNNTKIAIK